MAGAAPAGNWSEVARLLARWIPWMYPVRTLPGTSSRRPNTWDWRLPASAPTLLATGRSTWGQLGRAFSTAASDPLPRRAALPELRFRGSELFPLAPRRVNSAPWGSQGDSSQAQTRDKRLRWPRLSALTWPWPKWESIHCVWQRTFLKHFSGFAHAFDRWLTSCLPSELLILKTSQRHKAGSMHTCTEYSTPNERLPEGGLIQTTYWATCYNRWPLVCCRCWKKLTLKENWLQTTIFKKITTKSSHSLLTNFDFNTPHPTLSVDLCMQKDL